MPKKKPCIHKELVFARLRVDQLCGRSTKTKRRHEEDWSWREGGKEEELIVQLVREREANWQQRNRERESFLNSQ